MFYENRDKTRYWYIVDWENWQRQLEKTAVVKVGAYIDRKTTIYRLEACEIAFF